MRIINQKQEEGGQFKRKQKLQLCSKNGLINFKRTLVKDPLISNELNEPIIELEEPNMCLVCKTNDGKWLLTNYHSILETCFGVTVSNPSLKICDRCAQLVQTTSEFRELIRDAITQFANENVGNDKYKEVSEHMENHEEEKENDDNMNTIIPLSEIKPAQKCNIQRRANRTLGKRVLTTCDSCKHKYPMLVNDVNQPAATSFVCSRCKHQKPIERNLQCDQCRTIMPARSMWNHLENHARAKLFSRCRLRSLQEPFSKNRKIASSLEEIPEKPSKRGMLYDKSYICKICGKVLPCEEFFQRHMKAHKSMKIHECKVCGRIFKNQDTFERHSRIHQGVDVFKIFPLN